MILAYVLLRSVVSYYINRCGAARCHVDNGHKAWFVLSIVICISFSDILFTLSLIRTHLDNLHETVSRTSELFAQGGSFSRTVQSEKALMMSLDRRRPQS